MWYCEYMRANHINIDPWFSFFGKIVVFRMFTCDEKSDVIYIFILSCGTYVRIHLMEKKVPKFLTGNFLVALIASREFSGLNFNYIIKGLIFGISTNFLSMEICRRKMFMRKISLVRNNRKKQILFYWLKSTTSLKKLNILYIKFSRAILTEQTETFFVVFLSENYCIFSFVCNKIQQTVLWTAVIMS